MYLSEKPVKLPNELFYDKESGQDEQGAGQKGAKSCYPPSQGRGALAFEYVCIGVEEELFVSPIEAYIKQYRKEGWPGVVIKNNKNEVACPYEKQKAQIRQEFPLFNGRGGNFRPASSIFLD